MKTDPTFRYSVRPVPEGEALTFEEIEARCLEQIREKDGKCPQSLRTLSDIYARAGRHDEAIALVERLIALTDDPEQHAGYYLILGTIRERARDYRGAELYYRQALGREPCISAVWYFIHNNLGFSLNQLERHTEAIPYLRRAIEIDPGRPNGYKNLGLAFVATGRLMEAAELFVAATRVEASDPRSLGHLEDLIAAHPCLESELPDLRQRLEACREAVKVARAHQPDLKAAWERDRRRQGKSKAGRRG